MNKKKDYIEANYIQKDHRTIRLSLFFDCQLSVSFRYLKIGINCTSPCFKPRWFLPDRKPIKKDYAEHKYL